jgi:hypothetical protein
VDQLVGVFAIVMGVGMAGIWTRDILAGNGFETDGRLMDARETSSGNLMVWHWAAEYATAGALVIGGLLVLMGAGIGEGILLAALGALVYSATNSLAWSMARPERRPYAIPMLVGLLGGLVAIIVLLT